MNEEVRDFAAAFASAVIARDFDAAQGLLAPWLQRTMSIAQLEERTAPIEDLPLPDRFDLDSNSLTFEQLREPEGYPPRSEEFDPGLTAQNFRRWVCIEFKPSEVSEFSASLDLWMAVVDVDGRLAVGYLEATEPD